MSFCPIPLASHSPQPHLLKSLITDLPNHPSLTCPITHHWQTWGLPLHTLLQPGSGGLGTSCPPGLLPPQQPGLHSTTHSTSGHSLPHHSLPQTRPLTALVGTQPLTSNCHTLNPSLSSLFSLKYSLSQFNSKSVWHLDSLQACLQGKCQFPFLPVWLMCVDPAVVWLLLSPCQTLSARRGLAPVVVSSSLSHCPVTLKVGYKSSLRNIHFRFHFLWTQFCYLFGYGPLKQLLKIVQC